jgi:hypothetical protein
VNVAFDLKQATEDFYRDFPALKAALIVVDIAGTPETQLETLAAALRGRRDITFNPKQAESLLRNRGPSVAHLVNDDGDLREPDIEDAGMPLVTFLFTHGGAPADKSYSEVLLRDYFLQQCSLRAYYERRDAIAIPDGEPFRNDDYWLYKVFDHEAAHVLFKHLRAAACFGARGGNFEECVSDSYALIRHIQRFGGDTGFGRAMIMNRARLIPAMDTPYARAHMTVSCIEAVAAMDPAELQGLTPEQTFTLALRIADRHALKQDLLDRFAAASEKSRGCPVAERAGFYVDNGLPAPLVDDFLQAVLTLESNDAPTVAALIGARQNLAKNLSL